MSKLIPVVLLVALPLGLAGSAAAQVTTLAHYKLGDDDPGAAIQAFGNPDTLDSSVNGLDLTRAGSPKYQDTGFHTPSSNLSMQFVGASSYSRLEPVTTLTCGVGVEAWVLPGTQTQPSVEICYNGNTANSGFGIMIYNGNYHVLVGGVIFFDTGVAATPQWTHVAAVMAPGCSTSQMTFYWNGVQSQVFTTGMSPPPAMSGFSIGDGLSGTVDEVRVFEAGSIFDPSEFMIYSPGQPNTPTATSFWGLPVVGLFPVTPILSGNTSFEVSGAPGQGYLLAHSSALSLPGLPTALGLLDIDLLTMNILMDGIGFSTGTFFDFLANTGSSGTSSWSMPLGTPAPGQTVSHGATQVLVADPTSPAGFTLTAATAVTTAN